MEIGSQHCDKLQNVNFTVYYCKNTHSHMISGENQGGLYGGLVSAAQSVSAEAKAHTVQ